MLTWTLTVTVLVIISLRAVCVWIHLYLLHKTWILSTTDAHATDINITNRWWEEQYVTMWPHLVLQAQSHYCGVWYHPASSAEWRLPGWMPDHIWPMFRLNYISYCHRAVVMMEPFPQCFSFMPKGYHMYEKVLSQEYLTQTYELRQMFFQV